MKFPALVLLASLLLLTACKDKLTIQGRLVTFSLPSVMDETASVDDSMLNEGDKPYYLLTFWGTWCPACREEHGFLMQLSKTETMYGVDCHDDYSTARNYLKQTGNPFKKVAYDSRGYLTYKQNVDSYPTTYLVEKYSNNIYVSYSGELNEYSWNKEFVPVIAKLNKQSGIK